MIKKEIKSVAVSRESLPEIVYRKNTEEGKTLVVADLSAGNEVVFGRFPDKPDYLMKPLKWRVLSIEDGKALLIDFTGVKTTPFRRSGKRKSG